ncbi:MULTISPECIES: T7SS effector LXG polymorphic toxin [unclassified Sutcliffiella]|uniref:T7SS effector LXG polymorphic toxin n=1 Tax=unclassified Sutcliffiella TaxID=2837532 RepID=UPI0030D1A752
MKVLDVSSLHEGIKGMNRKLSELEKQLSGVENGIRSFVASKDSFRGKGASAIRRFYEYAHLPFLQFFQTFLANFQTKLNQLQYELDGLEGNARGLIDERFLTSELEDGLNQINRMVAELTGETNSQLSRVGDIVYLPRLQDHHFHEGFQQAKQSARQTVDKLHQFDYQQTQSFTSLMEDLSLIQSYIEEMSQQFASGKIKLSTFSPVILQDLEAYGKLQTRLYNETVKQRWNSEHYPELGVFYSVGYAASFDQWANPSCARPEPKKKTAGEVFWDFTNGFGTGAIDAVSDTWDGLKRLVTEPDQVLKETIELLEAVVSDPAILLEIGHELYNSFKESVIHGDANSRGEWLGYSTAIIGTAVVGDKGISRVGGTVGRLGSRVEADLNIKLKDQQAKALSSVPRSSTAGLERVRELMGGMLPNSKMAPAMAGVPSNAMNSFAIYEKVNGVNINIISRIEALAGKGSKGKDKKHISKTGDLKPNTTYQAGEYDYKYKTDDIGRIKEFNADDLKLTEREFRLPHKSNTPGKEPGDHAGHLAGDRFGGSPDLDNLVSQSSSVNLSKYKKLENQWANAIVEGKDVSVNVKINYEGKSLRPSSFDIEYEIDGRMRFISLEN